jgi:cell division protein FtsI (penicillin-binding protein 3)
MNIKRSILFRVRIAFLVMVLFSAAVIYRLVHIQVAEGDYWRQVAERAKLDYRKIPATRGSIYASGDDLLATSLPFYRVAFDPSRADEEIITSNLDSLSHLLSEHFGDDSSIYKKKISEARQAGSQYVVLNTKPINYQDKQAMMTWPIFNLGRNKGGVIFEKIDQRHRPFRSLARRTIGYINENNVGAGIERSYNDYLSGRDGEGLFQRVVGNNWKPVNASTDVRPINGYNVHTTIDINLQDVAHNALLRALTRYRANYGTVVLMEVKTGEIKAISNLERMPSGLYVESYNYAVAATNDPGSTFKLASMMALLEKDKVELSDSIDTGEGSLQIYNRTLKDVKEGGYGKITVEDVFVKSSNVGTAMMVNEHFGQDPQEFIDIVKETGYGQKLNFQLMGEGEPFIKDTDDPTWSGTSLPWMSVGYEMQVTPLQTLAFYNAVANDGKMIQPILVKSIRNADKVIEAYDSEVINKRIASKKTIAELRHLLEQVVEKGTASNIKNDYYQIAGKTGTAQRLVDGKYRTQSYYASFAGYFPAEEPQYSCIVVIDDPKGWNRYGGDVSAPVFKEIADMIYAQSLDIHDSFEQDLLAHEGTFPVIRAGKYEELQLLCNELGISSHLGDEDVDWVRSRVDNNAITWRKNHSDLDLVPNVQGMTLRDAIYLLENKGLRVRVSGNGRVKQQSIGPGRKVSKGQTINIVLG